MANLYQTREGKIGHQVDSNRYSNDVTTLSLSNRSHLFPELTTSPKKLVVSPPNHAITFPTPKLTRKDSLPLRQVPRLSNFTLGDLTNQHYISEVLSDSNTPIKNNSKTKSEIANIPKTFVRKIKLSDFDNYLNNVTTVFKQYQTNKAQVEGESSFKSLRPEETNLGTSKKELPSLADLPQHFHDPDFSLETAKSFNLVCSLLKKEEIVESEINLITSTELQDLLAHHMDLVETHLVHEIGERSEGFFSALSLLQNLEEETELCVQRIKELRECLGEIRQQQAKDNLLVIQLKRRRDNMDLLYETLNTIKKAWASQSALEFLLENNDPLSALELIDELKTQLKTLPDPSRTTEKGGLYPTDSTALPPYSNPITSPKSPTDGGTSINCLENLWSYLEDKQNWAIKLLKERFISIIVGESQISSKEYVDAKTALVYLQEKPTPPPTSPTQDNLDTSTLTRLNPIIISLLLNQQFLSTFSLVTESLIESLQNKISSILIRLLTHSTDSRRGLPKELSAWEDSELGHQTKGVTFDIFLEIVTVTFYHIVLAFQKTKSTQTHVVNLVREISSSSGIDGLPFNQLGKPTGGLSTTHLPSPPELTREMTVMTQSILDFSQTRCSHLLELRSTANVQLGLNDFYRLYQLVWYCITHLESFSGRSAAILRSSAITQAHTFFQHFHNEKMKYLTLNINSDSWASSPVAIEYQHIAGMIQHALHHGSNHPDFFFTSQDTHQDSAHIRSTLGKAVNKDQLMIDGTEYHVSLSGLALLKMVGEYLKCAFNLPSVTNDVSSRIVSLIENFNNQVCQAVLGAGAMRTAGLNRISARHISLASQTLAMALALIPGLRRCLELALGPEKVILMGQLDRVASDMSEHQSQLHSKLIAILADRAAVHLGRMQKVDWEAGSAAEVENPEEEQVSTYMRDLVNDVQSLHRIMTRYLKPRETQQIVTKVNQDYVIAVERAIAALPIRTSRAKRRLLRDVQYLISGLSSLPTQVANLHHLEVVVNDITL